MKPIRRGMRTALFLAALATGLVATAPAHHASAEIAQTAKSRRLPPVSQLVVQYRELALSAEFGGQARRGRIIKWTGPIIAQLRGRNTDLYHREVLRHFSLLSRLTGLNFRLLRPGQPGPPPNMIITFVNNGGRGPSNMEAVCTARVYSGRDFVIRRAVIRISADWNLVRRHCILEEITQALGLMNDSAYFHPSIFNDHSRQQKLSPWDEMVVRAHYDRRILPGMTWRSARPIVRDHFRRRLAASNLRMRQKIRRKKKRRR